MSGTVFHLEANMGPMGQVVFSVMLVFVVIMVVVEIAVAMFRFL